MNLETEIKKFKEKITNSFKDSETNFIYLRLSALDNEIKGQEEQITDALNKLQADFNKLIEVYPQLKINGFKLFVEVESAYKNTTRKEFINLYSNYLFNNIKSIEDILEQKQNPIEKSLYLSSFDRISRVFLYSLPFQLLRKLNNINIYSLLQEEISFENLNKDILEKDTTQQLIFVFNLMMFANTSAKHSEDLSNKIKKRVDTKNGVTISNKTGNKWGAEKTISDEMRKKIKERFKRFTAKEISEQVDIFQIKKGKIAPIAVNTILKIAKE